MAGAANNVNAVFNVSQAIGLVHSVAPIYQLAFNLVIARSIADRGAEVGVGFGKTGGCNVSGAE